MKYLTLLILLLVLSSCSVKKRVIKEETKEETTVIVKPETAPEISETPTKVEEPEVQIEEPQAETSIIKEEPAETIEVTSQETITPNLEAFNHSAWNDLLKKQVSDAGNVNYNSIKSNRKELTNYITALGDNMPNDAWSKEDKLAYWINAYNALTVDLILRNYPVKSIKDIKEPWDQRLWKLGEKWYNLNEIEHQILRKMDEPRIHFAIVCASFSCPKLQNEAFTASNMEAQLTNATKEFLSDQNRNNITANTLNISKIFKWFSKDFKTSGSISDFINTYTDIDISGSAKTSYKDYNWDLND